MTNGFIRVAAAVPSVNVADVEANVKAIIEMAQTLEQKGVEIAVFPEMCVTGYTCGDLFHSAELLAGAAEGIDTLVRWSSMCPKMAIIVGVPVRTDNGLYNCAAVIRDGKVEYVAKSYIPNYNEFYEGRWWHTANDAPASLRQRTFEWKG